MSLTSHLSELRKKHETLSEQVRAEARHPGGDSLLLTRLKKQKLAIKEEIEKLSHEPAH